jgi:hypothetical protein
MSAADPAEVAQLRQEVEALHDQLASERVARAARVRGVLSWVLVVLAVLATTLSLLAVWTFRTLTDTDLFVDRVGSVIEQPEVASAVGDAAAAQLVAGLAIEDRLSDALPDALAVAAGPISAAAEDYLAQGATALVETEQFRVAWAAALASGHRISIAVLSGQDTTAVQNTNGVIVLDLTPVVNLLLAQGADVVSDLLGREVTAPTITPDTIDQAVAALEERLGTDLPADFGQVTLFASDNLAAAQAAYQAVRVAVWLTPVVALVLAGLAIVVSTRRVRTAAGIVVGTGLLLVLVGLALQPLQSAIVGAVQAQGLAGAVAAGFDTVLGSLRSGIVLVVVLAVVAAAVLFLTGGSSAAATGRRLAGQAPSLAGTHRAWFLGGGAVAALLLLAALPGRSWGQLLVVLLLYTAYALAVLLAAQATAEPARSTPTDGDDAHPAADGGR